MGRTRVQFQLMYNEIARRLLLKQEPSAIALSMGVHEDLVKRILRKPEFHKLIDTLQGNVLQPIDTHLKSEARNLRDEIDQAAFKSFDRLQGLLDTASSEAVVKDIAQDLLDRAGYVKTQKVEQTDFLKVDPLTASILISALDKEAEGRKTLGKRVPTKTAGNTEHPIAKRMKEFADRDANDSSKSPSR